MWWTTKNPNSKEAKEMKLKDKVAQELYGYSYMNLCSRRKERVNEHIKELNK